MDSRYRSAPARITLAALGAIAAAAAALGVAAWSGPALASEHWMPSDCLPPPNSAYTAALHQQYAAGFIDLRNPRHMDFTSCDPPPPLVGGSTVHSFNSLVQAQISTDNGYTYQNHQAPAQVTVRVTNMGPFNGTTLYDTEMLQLDISGGNLPPGVRIRESPTLQSTGQTTIRPGAGGFYIDSFFDVFTELSLDNGATWMPSDDGAGHVQMDVLNPTPAMKPTWGTLKALYYR